jgi:hypothetical protein
VFSAGCNVKVALACSMGADVETAGLAQADKNMTIANNRDTLRFMLPLLLTIKVTVTFMLLLLELYLDLLFNKLPFKNDDTLQ